MTTIYRKYRPSLFSEISGQEYVIKTLTNAIKNDRISHAYLFTGPRGTGKTTTARIFAKTINCLQPKTTTKTTTAQVEPCNKCANCKTILKNQAIDLIEIDAASHTGVDNIRQLKEAINVPPTNFRYKVYIIDEVHMLSIGAFNALLKTLEEPPKHAVFILATTELHKVPDTILSRCQRFNIKPLTKKQIIDRLGQIAKKEKVKTDRESLELIATEANGGMRDAESLLGQIISLSTKEITAREIQEILGTSSHSVVTKMVQLISQNDLLNIVKKINQLQEDGINIKTFTHQLLNVFRDLMLLKISPENTEELLKKLTEEEIAKLNSLNKHFDLQNILLIISLLQEAKTKFSKSDIPQLPLEMSLIEYSLKNQNTQQSQANSSTPNHQVKNDTDLKKKTSPKINNVEPKQSVDNKPGTNASVTTISESKTQKNETPSKKNIANQDSKTKIKINTVLDNWGNILEEMKKHNQSILAFLENCAPLIIDGQSVIIKTRYPFHKNILNDTKNRSVIEKVFYETLNTNLKVKFLTEEESAPYETSTPTEETPSSDESLLYEAMKKMGGKIITEQ